ncbi:MAG: hypothetical protein IV092_25960 [Burkholderiaceae bacterium]|nr:hypothetical protein [Burkholderiaceae bacterium]
MNRAFPARPKACKRSSLRVLVLAASLAAAFGTAAAVGLGRPVTASSLGQPLNLIVPLRLDADEPLASECVSAEVLVGDSRLPAPLVRVVVEGAGDGAPRALRVITLQPVEEPVVVVNLSVGCPARLTRQFVAFIDPAPTQVPAAAPQLAQLPPLQQATAALEAPVRRAPATTAAPQLAQASPEPTPARFKPAAPNKRPKPRVVRLTADAQGLPGAAIQPAQSETGEPAVKRAARSAPAARASAPSGRLRLDAAQASVAPAATAASAVDVAALLAQAASQATGVESPEAQRLRQLESSLTQLRSEAKQTSETLAALRLQLQQAQQDRSPNSLIYGLGALALLLGAGCLYLWRLRERESHQREMAWWDSPEAAGHVLKQEAGSPAAAVASVAVTPAATLPQPAAVLAPVSPVAPEPVALASAPLDDGQTDTLPADVLEVLRASREPAVPLHEQTQAFARVSAAPDFVAAKYLPDISVTELSAPATGLDQSEPELHSDFARSSFGAHQVSAEELIDLEQQAEFFVVLGQDDAAVELLANHLQASSGASALPYLKLLEIHRRRSDVSAYAEIAAALTERFGVLPPVWDDADPAAVHDLEAYPEVLARLQRQWGDHGASMDLLQRLLVRPLGRELGDGGQPASSMDIAAYLDMLLLYSVARDLSEHEVRGDEVDVFLPLDQPGDSPLSTSMMATLPVQVDGPRSRLGALDLDISVGGDSVNSKL